MRVLSQYFFEIYKQVATVFFMMVTVMFVVNFLHSVYFTLVLGVLFCTFTGLIRIPLLQVGLFFTGISMLLFSSYLIDPHGDILLYTIIRFAILLAVLLMLGYSYFTYFKLNNRSQFFDIYRHSATVLAMLVVVPLAMYFFAVFFQPHITLPQEIAQHLDVIMRIDADIDSTHDDDSKRRLMQEKSDIIEKIREPWEKTKQEIKTRTDLWLKHVAYMNIALMILFFILIFLIHNPLVQVSFLFIAVETAIGALFCMQSIASVPYIELISYGITAALLTLLCYSYFRH